MNLGGTLGIAIGGTVFTNKLKSILSPENAQIVSENPKGIRKLANSEEIIDAVAVSLGFVYYFMIPIAALILICGLFIFEFRPEDRKDKKFDATAVVEDAI